MRRSSIFVALLCLTACDPPEDTSQTVRIEFEPRFGDQSIGCETTVDGVTMTDLRFYAYSAKLYRGTGTAQVLETLELSELGRWQHGVLGLALIDLEDAAGACLNGTSDTNSALIGTVPEGDYRGLSFEIEVPFNFNHTDPLAAAPPLDDSTMHWHWRSGYKFLRAGVETPDDGFWIHVGSAGCEGTVGDISGCRYPNRMHVYLPDYRLGDTVAFDFAELLHEVDLQDATPTDCSSGPSEEACEGPFMRLGLDFATGEDQSSAGPFRAVA